MSSPLQHLAPNLLRLDTALPWNLYDEAGHLLLSRGFVLVRNAQIDSLIERGVFVKPEEYRANNYPNTTPSPTSVAPPPPPKQIDPFRAREAMSGRLALLLRDAAQDPPQVEDFTGKIREVAGMVHLLCDSNVDATLAAIFLLDHTTKYPILHSIDTAVLADLLARKLDWEESKRRTVVCAALTMNIGMIDAQMILAQQRHPLTEIQKQGIAAHCTVGVKMLRAAGVTDELWLRIVADHHEVPDGSGYPSGKTDIDDATLLVRTLDIYTAKLMSRSTRKALDTAQAARTLFVQESKYQNSFVGLIVKELGLYPPGAYVVLKNGDTAVVSRRATASSPPLVHSFINSKGLPMLEPMWRDASKPEFAITSALPRDAVTTKTDLIKIWNAHLRT